MSDSGGVQVDIDLRAALRGIRALDTEAAKALRAEWRTIGDDIAAGARPRTRQQSRTVRALKGGADRDGPQVIIRNLSSVPFGVGAFMGAGRPQLPPWIGNASSRGSAPASVGAYGLPASVASSIDGRAPVIERKVVGAVQTAARRAGFDL